MSKRKRWGAGIGIVTALMPVLTLVVRYILNKGDSAPRYDVEYEVYDQDRYRSPSGE